MLSCPDLGRHELTCLVILKSLAGSNTDTPQSLKHLRTFNLNLNLVLTLNQV